MTAFPRVPLPQILLKMRDEGGFPIKTLRKFKDQWKATDPRDRQELKESLKANSQQLRAYESSMHNLHEEIVMETIKLKRPA